jgi:ESS family glutamate:Na+ symporter
MVWFFTSVGYNASFKLLGKGAVAVVLFLALATGMEVLQNVVGVGLAGVFGLDLKLGLCMGSIPLVGGHGTAASWGPMFEEMGVTGANVVAVAAATYGLVAGSLMGGPVARSLINKYNLAPAPDSAKAEVKDTTVDKNVFSREIMYGFCLLIVGAGIGMYITNFLSQFITMPSYIGPIIVAVIIRNVCDALHVELPTDAIDSASNVCLSIFLSLALMTLKLWQLIELALPMIVILAAETVLMFFLAKYVVFRVMGSDYDAAVLTAGFCGFGMGATPNAMANMQVITDKYGHSPKAYLVVPIVGGMFVDFTNTFILGIFSNLI